MKKAQQMLRDSGTWSTLALCVLCLVPAVLGILHVGMSDPKPMPLGKDKHAAYVCNFDNVNGKESFTVEIDGATLVCND